MVVHGLYGACCSTRLTISDVIETFFDSRLDLMGRQLKAQSARLKTRTLELIPMGLRTPAGGGIVLLDDPDRATAGATSAREGERREGGQRRTGDKYRRDVEREVERIKVKVRSGKLMCGVVPRRL